MTPEDAQPAQTPLPRLERSRACVDPGLTAGLVEARAPAHGYLSALRVLEEADPLSGAPIAQFVTGSGTSALPEI